MSPRTDNNKVMLTINETDEVNTLFATYVYSERTSTSLSKGRVDVLPPHLSAPSASSSETDRERPTTSRSVIQSCVSYLMNVFLPAGYPHSVTKDYLEYQIYDSVQAFSSSIAGLLSSRAVLQGVGVGDAAASPTSALLLQILQDTSGRIATILFAHRLGTALEPECKMYRLAADVFNDIAMILDCLSPLVRLRSARVAVISGAGVLRALCGVAAGSSKASLSAHFAKGGGNIGELNAKDSSQETVISLLGMLAGSIVVSHVTSLPATWISLISLLIIHLATNYRAVRAVQMTSLNRQRANIVFSTIFETDPSISDPNQQEEQQSPINIKILRPDKVAQQERIFEKDGVLRWTSFLSSSSSTSASLSKKSTQSTTEEIGWCRIGVSLQELLSSSSSSSSSSPSSLVSKTYFPALLNTFSSEAYIISLPTTTTTTRTTTRTTSPFKRHPAQQTKPRVLIILKHGCTPIQQLKAWAHALLAAKTICSGRGLLSEESNHYNEKVKENEDENEDEDEDEKKEKQVLEILSHSLKLLNARFDNTYGPELERAGWDLNTAALETRPGRRISISGS